LVTGTSGRTVYVVRGFPWFKDQPVNAIIAVEEVSQGHFYWQKIDVDLTVEMIKHPERFPLVHNN
jgi:hypothetical protein